MDVQVDDIVNVCCTHVVNLLKFYWGNTYVTDKHSDTHEDILKFVELLWTMDYSCLGISNEKGQLCPNYPARMFIPDACMKTALGNVTSTIFTGEEDDNVELCVPKPNPERKCQNSYQVLDVEFPGDEEDSHKSASLTIKANYRSIECVSPLLDVKPKDFKEYLASVEERTKTLQNLMEKAIYGRSRHRIVVPVILYNGIYVTRSATIPLAGEFYYRKAATFVYNFASFDLRPFYEALMSDNESERDDALRNLSAIDQARAADVALLKHLKINTVFDLMVEEKKVCYGVHTASSEKAMKNDEINHYSHLFINQVPYPGCEFFKEFSKTLHSEKLVYDWEHGQVNSALLLANERLLKFGRHDYKTWTLDYLTKHYLMIMLTHLKSGEALDGGILVHCISGWDRTPLFISLLRISLWADGEIHRSLCPLQMLYFTLAYDWMFFCHDMKLRTSRMELILFFCFYFLKFIKGENFNTRSEHFGRHIENVEYSGDFEVLSFKSESPDQSWADGSDTEIFNMSKSPENLRGNVAKTNKRDADHSQDLHAGSDELTQAEDDTNKPLAEKLLGRGMSSPSEPGAHMPATATSSERDAAKGTPRHRRITALRRIFFTAFKKSLPNVKGLGIMETNYEK